MFSSQIHITFNCREDERIISPILKHRPNKLYYFTAFIKKTKQKDANMSFYKKNVEKLNFQLPNLEIITKEIDYSEYIEIIQELSKIIKIEREHNNTCQIYLNASTGSKMTSLASVEASKLWNCKVYYLFAEEYDPESNGALHKGKMYLIEPITFPIQKPQEIYIVTIRIIANLIDKKYKDKDIGVSSQKFIYQKDLVNELEILGYLNVENRTDDKNKRKSSLYMRAKHNYLQPLENELKYIKISKDKRNKKIFLTKSGKDVLEIFRYYY